LGVLEAAPRACIITGLATSESQAARLTQIADTAREGFLARGLPADAIVLLSPSLGVPLRREAVLAALAPRPATSPDDETWLVFLGTSAPSRDGQTAFQLTGPRLTATDLATAVAALPGKKFVVVATSASGGFLPPLLALPDVEAVAATGDSGEISEPRFATFWAEALVAQPTASFASLAANAADRVNAHYTENSLAQGEHPRLIDRAAARIIEAPFPGATSVAPAPSAASSAAATPDAPVDLAAITIPKARTADEIERRPADSASLALLAAARAAAAGSPHSALILRTEVELLVAGDFSSRETWRTRAYLRTGEALDDLATLHLPSDPPFVTASLVSARVIRPDGAQLLLNPAARSARRAAEPHGNAELQLGPSSPPFIELPEVTADCIVEAEWTLDRRSDGSLPEFYHEWNFARPYPQKSLRVVLTLPAGSPWHVFAPQLPGGSTVNRTRTYDLADLPAHEPLPGDPPARTFTPWLGVSSVATWDTFAAWYRRLASGSDTTGPGIEALAADIAAAHPDRAGRLRAAYERVASLRYVAVELGVGAFRPRTPEQVWRQRFGDCKDKANLLVAVLAKLGIPAEFALVNRFDTTFTEFPGWQFNHALARVPAAPAAGQATDLWLDTTDRLVPFGIIAPGDLGRDALVFAPDFSTAAFHKITAAQEPPSEWRETFSRAAAPFAWQLHLTATGSAEVALRHLLLNLSPEAKRERLRTLLALPGASITNVTAPDPYDLSRPYEIAVTLQALAASPEFPITRPLAPGLDARLARTPAGRPELMWDDGRDWRYIRSTPSSQETTTLIPGRFLPDPFLP
jgi:hypothetical protein